MKMLPVQRLELRSAAPAAAARADKAGIVAETVTMRECRLA